MGKSINLDDRLEYKGYWYLPSNPENKIAGVLIYYPNKKIELELFGCFETSEFDLLQKDGKVDLIYGETSDCNDITLLQSYRSYCHISSGDFPIVKYSSSFLIIGKLVKSLDEKCKYFADVKFPELSYWCYPGALKIAWKLVEDDNKYEKATISFGTNPKANLICDVQIENEASIAIRKGVDYDDTPYRLTPKVEQYSYLEITSKNSLSIKDILSIIHSYEQFLSLATLKTVKCSLIEIKDQELFQLYDDKKYFKPIYLIHPYQEREGLEIKKPNCHDYLFDYETIKDLYPELLKNWFRTDSQFYPIRTHLVKSLEKKRIYGSIDFLIVIQAVEGFWWRFRDEDYRKTHNIRGKQNTKLETIITELLAEFGDINLINRLDINIAAVVDSRHYYSHFVNKSDKPSTLDGQDLFLQTKKLKVLLICCVLSFSGFDNSLINKIFHQSNAMLLRFE